MLTEEQIKERKRLLTEWMNGAQLQFYQNAKWATIPNFNEYSGLYLPDVDVAAIKWRIKPQLNLIPGEIYMVRDNEEANWTSRRYAGDNKFYCISHDNRELNSVTTTWKYIREATTEEVQEYLNPWKIHYISCEWPECRPNDLLEVRGVSDKIYAYRIDWGYKHSLPIYWRYAK